MFELGGRHPHQHHQRLSGCWPAALGSVADYALSMQGAAAYGDQATRVARSRGYGQTLAALTGRPPACRRRRKRASATWLVAPLSVGQLEVFSRYLQQTGDGVMGKRLDRAGQLVHQGLAVGYQANKGSFRPGAPTCSNCVMESTISLSLIDRLLDDPARFKGIDG